MTALLKYTTNQSAGLEVDRRAERYMTEKGCGYQEAFAAVLACDRQLAQASAGAGPVTPTHIMAKRGSALDEVDQGLVAAVRHARISGNVQSRLAFPIIMSTSSHQSTRGAATAYPWGWLGVLGTVIVMMITGAGWLYQKNEEWPVPATQDPRNAAYEQTPATAATPSGQGSVAERVRDPSDVAPAVAEPSVALEPALPLPETVDTETDRGSDHAGADAPHASPPVGTPPAGTYTIQRGDTLIAIAAHFYGDASQWSVIAEANPEADPRRLRIGQKIKLPPRPGQSR